MDKIKILVCDDADETRNSIKRIVSLEDKFQLVGEAKNGKEAVDMCKKIKPDIVLMDINMPEMDGIQATEVITLNQPFIGIIILSVQGEQEYLRKAMSAGAREYLVKPFSPDELINAVERTKIYIEKRKEVLIPPQIVEKKEKEKHIIICIFGTKGGVGKSLIATNLAIALKKITEKEVVLIDLDFQFGDIAIM
jgi:pilus assembly protein CpaE